MKKQLLVLLLNLFIFHGFAQIATVIDAGTGIAIDRATITSQSPRAFTTTNSKGQANVSTFAGSPEIEIRVLGYKTVKISYQQLVSDNFYIAMEPSVITLDNVVISATRWEQAANDIPMRIKTISAKEVGIQNPQTAADLLKFSGEVFVQKSQQGGGSPMIRGFATNRLLYAVDGVRMNTAIFRSGNIQNVISLDPFATEETEVLFGPGSVIYGSDAIGGVMSFQTLTPQLSLEDKPHIGGSGVVRYSIANNEKTAHFHVNAGGKKLASITSFTSYDFGDLRMGSHGPDEYLRPFFVQRIDGTDEVVTNSDTKIQRPSGYSQINMMQKFTFRPNTNWDVNYGFHYSATSNYSRYDRHIRTRDGLPRYGEWYYGPQKWMMNNLAFAYHVSNSLFDQLTIRLAHQAFEESRVSRDMNKFNREIRTEQVDALSANIDFMKELNSRGKLYYGLEAVHNDVTSKGIDEDISTGIKADGPSRYPQSTWASYAAYLSSQFQYNEKLLLQAGLRYNLYALHAEFDTRFYPFPFTEANMDEGALTGSVGIVYRPSEKWVLSLNTSTGFRSPNVDDAGKVFDSEPGSVVVPNPDLKAEYAYNVEFGAAKIFGDAVKLDFTAYYTLLDNAMVRRDFTLNGLDSIMYDGEMSKVQAVQNAAVARVYGMQSGVEVKLPAGFGVSSHINYQKGEEELDDGSTSPSRHAPPMFGVSKLTYRADKLNMQLYAEYSGEKSFDEMPEGEKDKDYMYAIDNNGNPFSPAWYTINLKAIYQLSDQLLVSAGLENITDQRYRPYSSGIVAPGRNMIVSLRANF